MLPSILTVNGALFPGKMADDTWGNENGDDLNDASHLQDVMGGEPTADVKLFNKWSVTEISVSDIALKVRTF